MTAKEMFEQLGYKLTKENSLYIYYQKDTGNTIRIDKDSKSIEKYVEDIYQNRNSYGYITYKELQAINKQVEELGWK